ncbi:cation channel sperm-associated protein 4-like isoform X2 [Chiloscyllium plagiosum]|uniref:cation channel sperm-associated protein 4-like isoform X2 n=1 Tax=Chiloscyllium plagiosum TaxID=36176 RepID=UPI001CB7F27A|nr:cation channel sperm-associated protein 4-like isoform X2 [Chiloscyllium plagiosum]
MANYTHTTNIMDLAGLQDLRKHSVIEPRITIKELTINFNDIIEGKDEWSVQDKISQKVLRKLLDHIVLRSFIIALLIGSCIAISCQTDPAILESYAMFFAIFEQILVTIFLWEMLLKWYYGFWIFWKDGWNIADFFVTSALFIGSTASFTRNHELFYVLRVLRALRMVRSLAAIQGLAIMVQVIIQSVSDMANVIFLLILITLVFAVFGVIIFSTAVPESFGSLEKAMYSLFICITQDGWVQIYEQFVQKDGATMYWGALYLFIFIIGASFIFANIMVAAVTSNLEQAMIEQEEKRHTLTDDTSLMPELKDEGESGPRMPLIHVQDCIRHIIMAHKQQPMKYSSLENLNLTTYEEFCLVLEAIQRNIMHYKQIRLELNSIVKELRDILFNREQQKQIMHHEKRILDVTEALLTNDMPTFKKKEMLSHLLGMEKVRKANNSNTGSSLYSRASDIPQSSSHIIRHVSDN